MWDVEAPRPKRTVLPVCPETKVPYALNTVESRRPVMKQHRKRTLIVCAREIWEERDFWRREERFRRGGEEAVLSLMEGSTERVVESVPGWERFNGSIS